MLHQTAPHSNKMLLCLVYKFLDHISSFDPNIQFTKDNTWSDGPMPFPDTLVTSEQDRTLSTTVYRRPTHTDQYLH